MKLPAPKSKIVCTIGSASRSEAVLERLMLLGMNMVRPNFAHGALQGHREDTHGRAVRWLVTAGMVEKDESLIWVVDESSDDRREALSLKIIKTRYSFY